MTRERVLVTLSRVAAAIGVAAALSAAATLFAPWHTVSHPSATAVAAALYFGPDYHVSAADRARMLEPTEHRVCSGLDHFETGAWPPLVFGAMAVLVALSLRVARARRHALVAIGLPLAAFALFYFVFSATFLRHLFESTGPSSGYEIAFARAHQVLTLAVLVLTAAHIALAWQRRSRQPPPERSRDSGIPKRVSELDS